MMVSASRRHWVAQHGCASQREGTPAAAARRASPALVQCRTTYRSHCATPVTSGILANWPLSGQAVCRRRRLACSAAPASAAGAAPTGRVYLATCPLVGWEATADSLGAIYPDQLALHHYVVVELVSSSGSGSSGDGGGGSKYTAVAAFDFLPEDPTSPLTAARLLSGGSVKGLVRCRPLQGVPRQRCQLRGTTYLTDPHAAAEAFQQRYDCRLQLLQNDCTHHAAQLIAHLLRRPGPAS